MEKQIMRKCYFLAAILLALAACSQNQVIEIPDSNELSLIAKTEGQAESKTVVEDGTHVYWEPGDEIKVFSGNMSGKFVTDITIPYATAMFNGTLGTGTWTEGMDLWAVYPFNETASFSGETITTTLPAEQTARRGSFGKGMNLSIAHSNTLALRFYNVCGGVCLSLSGKGIQKIILEGMDGEILAGNVTIGFQEGVPAVQDITEGKTSITLTPSEGESFEKDTWYYIMAIPGTLKKGFTLYFQKGDNFGSRVFDKNVSIKRGIFGRLTQADKGAVFTTVSDDIITFKDELVKSILIKYFDTDGDGELSYREAAAVHSFMVDESETKATEQMVSIFAGTDITSFDEMVYFTGLTRIEEGVFADCEELESLTIPETVTVIGDNAFNGCTSLEAVTLTSSTPPAIGTDAFANTGDCPIMVPDGAEEEYASAWSEYENRIEGYTPVGSSQTGGNEGVGYDNY